MMSDKFSKQPKRELLEVLRQRYERAAKTDKGKILDEFVAVAGCHHKHAIRLLTTTPLLAADVPFVARRTYDEAVCEALIVLWEAADRICGKRLEAVLPGLVAAPERHGHLHLDPVVRQRVLTMDRLLALAGSHTSHRKKRRAATRSIEEILVRTFADYGDASPGCLEIDFVSHGGTSMKGVLLWSLVATDVCSGWTEAVALVAREQSPAVEELEVLVPRGLPETEAEAIRMTLADPAFEGRLRRAAKRVFLIHTPDDAVRCRMQVVPDF